MTKRMIMATMKSTWRPGDDWQNAHAVPTDSIPWPTPPGAAVAGAACVAPVPIGPVVIADSPEKPLTFKPHPIGVALCLRPAPEPIL